MFLLVVSAVKALIHGTVEVHDAPEWQDGVLNVLVRFLLLTVVADILRGLQEVRLNWTVKRREGNVAVDEGFCANLDISEI